MLKRYSTIAAALLVVASGVACGQDPKGPLDRNINAALEGNKEIPPSASPAKGTLQGVLTMATRELRWTLNCSSLSGPVTATHFHGPASPDKNANIALPMPGDCSAGQVQGRAILDQTQFSDILEGKWYVNVHTSRYPAGEIRGQVAVIRRD